MLDVDKESRLHRRLLLVALIAFAIWDGMVILDLSPGFAPAARQVFSILSWPSALVWAVCLVCLLIWTRRVRGQPEVYAALNDEMTVRNRWRATRASMSVLMVCLAAGVVLAGFVHISALLALSSLIWVLVVTKLGFFLWYDRSE